MTTKKKTIKKVKPYIKKKRQSFLLSLFIMIAIFGALFAMVKVYYITSAYVLGVTTAAASEQK